MKNNSFALLTLIPFILFIFGYIVSYILMNSTLYQTPSLVGLRLSQALNLAAKNHATIKLLSQQEAPGVEAGTIISQKPNPGRLIKKNQTILVTIAKENAPTQAPDIVLKKLKDCTNIAHELGIQLKTYPIVYPLSKDICIGQIPEKDTFIPNKKMISYTAQEKINTYIMPNFIGKRLNNVIKKLEQQQISYKIFENYEIITPPFCDELIINNQKPKAGSFISLDKTFILQLEVT